MTTFAGFEAMNGATLSRIVDGAGAVWRGCCMQRTGNKPSFGFYITKNGIEVPYAPFCTARGQVTRDGWWTAWNGAQYFEGLLPGFVPLPNGDAALEARIALLEQTIANLPPTVTGPTLFISAQGGTEGGEIQLAAGDGGGPWCIDVRGAELRFHRGGVVYERWPK